MGVADRRIEEGISCPMLHQRKAVTRRRDQDLLSVVDRLALICPCKI
jgi:hypothetical protein